MGSACAPACCGRTLELEEGWATSRPTLAVRIGRVWSMDCRFSITWMYPAAGVTHIVHPTWPTLGSGPISLAVAITGDGVADEFIPLDNQAPSTALWTGWDGGKVWKEIETRQGAAVFRVVAQENDPLQVESSRDVVEWSSSGMVPANSWPPLAAPAGVASAEEGPIFIGIIKTH